RRAFAGASYVAAGKTGTAQVYSLRGAKYRASEIDERLRDHALYMAFAPVDQPKIALALLVENAGWGGSVAAPLARAVFDYWLVDRLAPGPLYEAQDDAPETQVAQQTPPSATTTGPRGVRSTAAASSREPRPAAANTPSQGGAGAARAADSASSPSS